MARLGTQRARVMSARRGRAEREGGGGWQGRRDGGWCVCWGGGGKGEEEEEEEEEGEGVAERDGVDVDVYVDVDVDG